MRKIELPSEELAEELQKDLERRNLTGLTYDKSRRTIQFPDDMNPSQWPSIRSVVEKWAKGKHLEVIESLRVQSPKPEIEEKKADPKEVEAEVKKRLEKLTPKTAEERYNYLVARPISELTDAEIEERLALAQRSAEKDKEKAQKK